MNLNYYDYYITVISQKYSKPYLKGSGAPVGRAQMGHRCPVCPDGTPVSRLPRWDTGDPSAQMGHRCPTCAQTGHWCPTWLQVGPGPKWGHKTWLS